MSNANKVTYQGIRGSSFVPPDGILRFFSPAGTFEADRGSIEDKFLAGAQCAVLRKVEQPQDLAQPLVPAEEKQAATELLESATANAGITNLPPQETVATDKPADAVDTKGNSVFTAATSNPAVAAAIAAAQQAVKS